MIPERITCWDCCVAYPIKLKEKLCEMIPFFLKYIQHESTFSIEDIDRVIVVSVDTSERDDGEWGAGLRVFLTRNRYFQIYIPFHTYDLHPFLDDFQEELQESVHIHSTDEPFQDIFYKHNVYLLDDACTQPYTLYKEDLKW